MNRNNFFIHLALALVLILVAAFAGQLSRWRKQWKSHAGPFPVVEKKQPSTVDEISLSETRSFGNAEVLVKFKSGVSDDAIEALTNRLHDRVEDRIENADGVEAIDDLDNADATSVAAEYNRLPEVEYAEPNYEIKLEENEGPLVPVLPRDPQFEDQWALSNSGQRGGKKGADISAPLAWSKTTGSEDVVVAVLDTGVDYNHEDLAANMWTRPDSLAPYHDNELGTIDDVNGFNAVDNATDPMDDNGHGTHCAGIIGAEGENDLGIAGVNWKVQIMPLKFMNAGGSGTTKDAIEAINYAIERKKAGVNVRIISASWGSTQRSRALEAVIRKAYENDILFVAAAGNSSTDNDRIPHYPSSYNVPNVISVAALDRHDQLASFSNFGAKSVAIAAPGVDILSTWLGNAYEEKSGTSMATPVVSGVAALVLAEKPRMSVDDLRKKLMASTDPIVALKGKTVAGGRINAAKALD
ncbi:MAG TPA: S8 family peptidase [Pyrinomonadaceae bacterium]|jgi:subtilisin family serine protease|nr:S8 family peptidase [Pyrinomonadaceae bacterium]